MVKKVQTIKINVLIILFFNGLIFKCYLGKPRKKSSSLNGRAIKRGGGVKGRAIKKKRTFFQRTKISTAIKLEGGREVRRWHKMRCMNITSKEYDSTMKNIIFPLSKDFVNIGPFSDCPWTLLLKFDINPNWNTKVGTNNNVTKGRQKTSSRHFGKGMWLNSLAKQKGHGKYGHFCRSLWK